MEASLCRKTVVCSWRDVYVLVGSSCWGIWAQGSEAGGDLLKREEDESPGANNAAPETGRGSVLSSFSSRFLCPGSGSSKSLGDSLLGWTWMLSPGRSSRRLAESCWKIPGCIHRSGKPEHWDTSPLAKTMALSSGKRLGHFQGFGHWPQEPEKEKKNLKDDFWANSGMPAWSIQK